MIRIISLCLLITLTAQAHSQKKTIAKDPLRSADSLFLAGNFKSAVPEYERALKITATAAVAQPWFRLGASHHSLKEYAKALEAYRKAEKINGRQPGLRVNLAKVLSAMGDAKSSIVVLDSAVRQGFGNYKVLDKDPEFANLRNDAGFAAIRSKVYLVSHPCESLPTARALDFWLGEWNVYQTSNPSVQTGVNTITKESGGCVILESWESQGSHNGVSINYYDPVDQEWKQKWAGSGQDIQEFYDGHYADSVMRFKYDIVNQNGSKSPGMLEFTNMKSGKVRQHFQSSTDEGKTWQTVYDFTYVRKKS